MARPAHPRSHDARLISLIERALAGEVLIPCPDKASALLIRSRIREYIRAHKEWETGEADRFKGLRTKMHHTHLILPVRPDYNADSIRSPYTLALDSRDVMDEILAAAAASDGHIPLTRKPQDSSAAMDFDDDFDTDEDENAYLNILENMTNAPRQP